MKRFAIVVSLLLPCLLTVSCGKENNGNEVAEPAQLGVVVKDVEGIVEVPKSQNTALEITVAANPGSAEAYTITLAANPGLVAAYNTANGTSYEMLPSEAYSFSSTTVMLPRYTAKSTPCELRLKGQGCVQDKVYLLPIVIDGVQGGTNFSAPDDKAAYILFKMTAAAAAGSGTQESPYIINSVDTFFLIDKLLKDNETVYFKMTEDIDFSTVTFSEENPWTPINYASDDEGIAAAENRKVDFDGNKHKISNFTAGGALFANLSGSVRDLTIEKADIACLIGNVGAVLAGNAKDVTIKGVTVKKSKINNDYKRSGGLVAWLKSGTIENVEVECDLVGDQQMGGLVGRVEEGSIINCSATAQVEANNYYAGALIGFAETVSVKGCKASGKVIANGSYARAGGLIGEMHGGSVESSSANVEVEGPNGHFGGAFIGVADAVADITVSKSFATGSARYTGTGNKAGYSGFIGRMEKGNLTVTDCYSTGAVKAFRWSAGFIGDVNKGNLTINNGYTTSDISAIGPDGNGAYQRGLVVGNIRSADQTVITCSKFIGWKTNADDAFCFPADAVSTTGNYYGNEGTVTTQAVALGWSSDVWNLSGNAPILK